MIFPGPLPENLFIYKQSSFSYFNVFSFPASVHCKQNFLVRLIGISSIFFAKQLIFSPFFFVFVRNVSSFFLFLFSFQFCDSLDSKYLKFLLERQRGCIQQHTKTMKQFAGITHQQGPEEHFNNSIIYRQSIIKLLL